MPQLEGTLVDHHGQPTLAGWTAVFEILDENGTILGRAATVADATSRFTIDLPAGDVRGHAFLATITGRTHPIEASVASPAEGQLLVTAPVLLRRGRCYLDGAPPSALRNYLVLWRDTADNDHWQGARTDANGDYERWEEQARPYTVYALSEVAKTWLVLRRIVDNPDGARDLYFGLWSWPNHPFYRRDNPLGGLADAASREI